jgi:hypothetical protein
MNEGRLLLDRKMIFGIFQIFFGNPGSFFFGVGGFSVA